MSLLFFKNKFAGCEQIRWECVWNSLILFANDSGFMSCFVAVLFFRKNMTFSAVYSPISIKDLFDNIEAHKVIDFFVKETRFYKQL